MLHARPNQELDLEIRVDYCSILLS
jgi:hypothetical protein